MELDFQLNLPQIIYSFFTDSRKILKSVCFCVGVIMERKLCNVSPFPKLQGWNGMVVVVRKLPVY